MQFLALDCSCIYKLFHCALWLHSLLRSSSNKPDCTYHTLTIGCCKTHTAASPPLKGLPQMQKGSLPQHVEKALVSSITIHKVCFSLIVLFSWRPYAVCAWWSRSEQLYWIPNVRSSCKASVTAQMLQWIQNARVCVCGWGCWGSFTATFTFTFTVRCIF